jgi:Large polyvalent protein associated domain 23
MAKGYFGGGPGSMKPKGFYGAKPMGQAGLGSAPPADFYGRNTTSTGINDPRVLSDAAPDLYTAPGTRTALYMTAHPSQVSDLESRNLNMAKSMETTSSSQDVRRKTGWFRSYGGQWRREIDDSKASMKFRPAAADAGRLYKLSDVLDHTELYKNSPDIGNETSVVFYNDPSSTTRAAYYDHNNRIEYNTAITKDNDSQGMSDLQIMLHELQHALQSKNGFTENEALLHQNALPLVKYWMSNSEREARNASRRSYLTAAERATQDPSEDDDLLEVQGYLMKALREDGYSDEDISIMAKNWR